MSSNTWNKDMNLEAVLNDKTDKKEHFIAEKKQAGTVETLARLSFIARRQSHFSDSKVTPQIHRTITKQQSTKIQFHHS